MFIFYHKAMTVTNPNKIANILNDYFSTIAEKTKRKIKFSNKSLDEFLQHTNENSFFRKPAASDEIVSLISPLNGNKTVGLNILQAKTKKKLLKNDIYLQMANTFNLFLHRSLSF